MTVISCATTLKPLKIARPSRPCPQHDFSEPLVNQLAKGYTPPFYPESKDICDTMITNGPRDMNACIAMYNIVMEYGQRERCLINHIDKYNVIDVWEN